MLFKKGDRLRLIDIKGNEPYLRHNGINKGDLCTVVSNTRTEWQNLSLKFDLVDDTIILKPSRLELATSSINKTLYVLPDELFEID